MKNGVHLVWSSPRNTGGSIIVIDKLTGRGCAWSIASKTVTKQLIAEGIVGRAIFRKPCPNKYNHLCVVKYGEEAHVMLQRGDEMAEEPLWSPSFIDAEIWKQAVSKFHVYTELDRNVEKHLLPEMGEYLQSIPDADLVSMTRDFLIKHGVINKPISQRRGKTYYFNENEVYSLDKESRLFPYEGRTKFCRFEVMGETCFNMNVWLKAVSQFKVGTTLTECIKIFLKTELAHRVPKELSSIDRLVQHISPPKFERVPENQDERTFDYIRMTVGLPRYRFDSWEALQDEVKKNLSEIYQRVLQRLENDRQFERYRVPINFLKTSDIILRRDYAIEFIFEIKKHEVNQLPGVAGSREPITMN